MHLFRRRLHIRLLCAAVSIAALVLSMPHPAGAYKLLDTRQRFYYRNVVDFQWGELTRGGTPWTQLFQQAGYQWSVAQNILHWGAVPRSTNQMQVYSKRNSAEFGQTIGRSIGGYYTWCSMEVNRYSLQDKSWPFRLSVAVHELGHGMGLGDDNEANAVMSQARDRESLFAPTMDDIAGLIALYRQASGGHAANTQPAGGDRFTIGSLLVKQLLPDGHANLLILDVPVYHTVRDLTQEADVVIVGRVTGRQSSRNLARHPGNQFMAAKGRQVPSQEYTISVERWLKGKGGASVRVVYPERVIVGSNFSLQHPEPALQAGQRYVLFLRRGQGYYGVGFPWQFQLESGQARPRVWGDRYPGAFAGLTEKQLIGQVEGSVRH